MRVKIKSKRTDEQLSILKSFSIMCIYLGFLGLFRVSEVKILYFFFKLCDRQFQYFSGKKGFNHPMHCYLSQYWD